MRRLSETHPPAPGSSPKNWTAYRSRFIEPVRVQAGLRFWDDNAETLARAEQALARIEEALDWSPALGEELARFEVFLGSAA